MNHYVVGFFFNEDRTRVILIEKRHPKWQAGKLNGVGGHIERDEDATAAMVREFREETGIQTDYYNWKHFARLQGPACPEWAVDFFWCSGPEATHQPQKMTDENPLWLSVNDVLCGVLDLMVIPNLRYLLPMAQNDVERRDACRLFVITEAERYPQ